MEMTIDHSRMSWIPELILKGDRKRKEMLPFCHSVGGIALFVDGKGTVVVCDVEVEC